MIRADAHFPATPQRRKRERSGQAFSLAPPEGERGRFRALLFLIALAASLAPEPLRACAACFGESDSPLAKGMNMGIFSLLVVVVFVLGGIAAFFIYLAKKSSAAAAVSLAQPLSPETHRSP